MKKKLVPILTCLAIAVVLILYITNDDKIGLIQTSSSGT